ncbi:MAG: hypothetical protein WC314_21470 [Vulcanimicrobiota bacterium]
MRLFIPVILSLIPVAVFLQSTLLAQALPGGVTPSLTFLLVLASGFRLGAAGGAATGLWGGALIGAAAGALAVPLSLFYGTAGFLAGVHCERKPHRWTLPLVSLALFALLISGESWLLRIWEGREPSLSWKFASLGWMALASLVFLALPRLRER